ncbi:hypothetical protein AYI70_g7381 [Smittium culicis]|uniref:Uncharacterized protein n=1 Tax=Smittium culicis TaxID=133412 RepID=A0A1R1XKZ9_9FUNG|nr:hypothetical protein AYI70_g7381 [Smittium culicis]
MSNDGTSGDNSKIAGNQDLKSKGKNPEMKDDSLPYNSNTLSNSQSENINKSLIDKSVDSAKFIMGNMFASGSNPNVLFQNIESVSSQKQTSSTNDSSNFQDVSGPTQINYADSRTNIPDFQNSNSNEAPDINGSISNHSGDNFRKQFRNKINDLNTKSTPIETNSSPAAIGARAIAAEKVNTNTVSVNSNTPNFPHISNQTKLNNNDFQQNSNSNSHFTPNFHNNDIVSLLNSNTGLPDELHYDSIRQNPKIGIQAPHTNLSLISDPVEFLNSNEYTISIYGDQDINTLANTNISIDQDNKDDESTSSNDSWTAHANNVIEEELKLSEAWTQAWSETSKASSLASNGKFKARM